MKKATIIGSGANNLSVSSNDAVKRFASKFLKISVMAVFTLLLFFIVAIGGVNLGSDALSDTMYVSEDLVEEVQAIQLGEGDLIAAEAASGGSKTARATLSGSTTTLNGSKQVAYGLSGYNMSGYVSYVSYWAGKSSNTNVYQTSNGKFGIYGSGTVRQKRITMNAYVNFELGDVLEKLAASGVNTSSGLRVTLSGTFGTGNGYDQDFYAGAKFSSTTLYAYENSGDSRLTGFTKASAFRKSAGSQSFSVTIDSAPTSAKYIVLGVCATCNYTGWVGGRLPDAYMQAQTLTFTSKDTVAPTMALTTNYMQAATYWQSSRKVSVRVSDNVATASLPSLNLYGSGTNIYSAANVTNGGTVTTSSASNFSSGLTGRLIDRSNINQTYITYYNSATSSSTSSSTNVAQTYLKIDTTAPTINGVQFVKSTNLSQAVPATGYNGTVSMLITVTDTQSGIGQVIVTNRSNSAISGVSATLQTTVSSNSYPASVRQGVYKVDLGNNANGEYTIIVRDNTRDYNNSLSDSTRNATTNTTYSFALQDVSSPVINAPSFSFAKRTATTHFVTNPDGTATTTAYSSGSSTYANNYITMTFTVTDTTGSSYSAANTNLAQISAIKIFYYYDGQVRTATPTQSGSSFTNPTRTYTYTFNIPYSSSSTGYTIALASGAIGGETSCNGYTIWVADKTGNPRAYTNISVKLDTISPVISSRSLSSSDGAGTTAGKGFTSYANKNITLTVVCTDALNSQTSYPGVNNGSGISAIYIYNAVTSALVDSKTGLSGGSITQTFTLTANSSSIYNYRIIVFDHAGNCSQWGIGNAIGITNFYYNPTLESNKTFYTMKDAVTPTIAFEYSLDGTNYIPISLTANDTFTFPWMKDTQVKFRFKIVSGSSGGNFIYLGDSTTKGTIGAGITYSGGNYTINAANNVDSQTPLYVYVTQTAEGIRDYRYQFVNGANVTVLSPTIRTKIDRTEPAISLLGFGDYLSTAQSFSSKEQAAAAIVNKRTEDSLTNESAWLNAFGLPDIYGIFYVEDGYSGVGTGTISNSTGTETSKAKVTVKFSHNGYEYNQTVYPILFGSVYIVQVRFWSHKDMPNAMKGAVSFRNANLDYDLKNGDKLRYNVTLYDFIGNTSAAFMKGNNVNMEYCVDPFEIRADLLSIVEVDPAGNQSPYDCVSWTRNKVVVTIQKTISLTPTFMKWGSFAITDQPDGRITGGSADGASIVDYPDADWKSINDSGTSKIVSYEFPAISRCAQVFFKIYNSCSEGYPLFGSNDFEYFYIRQDTSGPLLQVVAFSPNPALRINDITPSNSDILIYYEHTIVKIDDVDTHVWTRLSSNTASNVWTTGSFVTKTIGGGKITYEEKRAYLDGVYMYVLATDTQGTDGTGSGINYINVKLDGVAYETLNLMSRNTATTTEYKVLGGGTNPTYTGSLENSHYYHSDNGLGLYCSNKQYGYASASAVKSLEFGLLDNQNNNSNISVTYDKDNKKIMPVYDKVKPEVNIKTATYGGVSYMSGGFFNGIQAIKLDLNITFGVYSGVSGAKLYYRLRTYDEVLGEDNPYKLYNTTDIPFGMIDKTAGIGGWTEIKNFSSANTNASVPYTINKDSSLRNRFEVLLVTTTGAFYYRDCGNVFIDSTPPTIDAGKTFFTRYTDQANNNSIVDYDSITKVNDVVTGTNYTNDSIYAYFSIYDTASGIYQVYYDNQGTPIYLDVVRVRRIVGGEEVVSDYYRMLIEGRNTYKVTAVDYADNISDSSTFTPNIDKSIVEIIMSAVTYEGANYILGTGNVFTKSSKVQVTITVNYGASGFGGVSYSVDGGAWTPISTGNLFGEGWAKTSGVNQHKVTVYFTNEQNSTYSFRAYNKITNSYAVGGARPYDSNNMRIAIDHTDPKIDKTLGNYNLITSYWHGSGQALQVAVTDLNTAGTQQGSGVASVKLDYSINGQAQDEIMLTLVSLVDGLYTYTTGSQTLQYYTDYVLTMTDNAGRQITQIIRPKIDSNDPTWGVFSGTSEKYKMHTDESHTTYVANTWSKEDIKALVNMVYTMSGVQLQYYRSDTQVADPNNIAASSWTSLTGGSAQWSNSPPLISDATKTMTKYDVEYLISILAEANVSQYHYLRMVSGAGRVSEILSLGFVRIDKETPKIAIASRINNNNTNWGTVNSEGDTTTFANWTSSDLTMNLTSNSTLVSGYTVYYRLSTTSQWNAVPYDYSGSAVTYKYGKTGSEPNAHNMTLTHKVTESTNKATYQYYIASGSGMESIIYTISEIKIDTASPTANVAARTSNIFGTDNGDLLNTATSAQYIGDSYTIANPSWVRTNSVIVAVTVRSISYSGVKLYINSSLYDTFNYGEPDTTKYYVVSQTTALAIRLVSGADKQTAIDGRVNIDNDIPIVYVVGEVGGTKASNWDSVTEFADKWYTSKATINLVVGRYINNGDGTYTYQEDTMASDDDIKSGYTIYYSINGGDWISNDQVLSVNANNIDTSGNFIDPIRYTFRFKIVSGSGMSYEMGGDAINNVNAVAVNASDIKTLIENNNGLINNLNDTDYLYTVNVDSRDFVVIGNHIMPLTMANGNNYDWIVGANDNPVFSADTVYISSNGTSGGTFTETTAVSFKRGDYLKISYDTTAYEYIFRYADYGVYDGENWSGKITNASAGNSETEGSFYYSFVNDNLAYNAYFMKELDAEFDNLKLFLQSETVPSVEAHADFVYKNAGGANERLDLTFDYIYKDMEGNVVDKDNLTVGGYVVTAVISDNNIISFRLSNPSAVLFVKYFTETEINGEEVSNSETYPYSINNEADLKAVSTQYYDGYTENDGVFTLNAPKSYLTSYYKLTSSINLASTFGVVSGTFSGNFDGNNNQITMAGGEVEGYYGLFERISGSVSNLAVVLGSVLGVKKAQTVGILAREIVNGTVKNVYVKGDISLIDSYLDASIGGLAGYTENSVIGEENNIIFSEVSIYNNGNSISRAYIGGLIGYVGINTILNYTYTYGDITLYNVGEELEAGMVFGKIDSYFDEYNRNTFFFNNYYMEKAVFINDTPVLSFSSQSNIVNDASETQNTISARTYAEFIAGNTEGRNVGATEITGKAISNLVLIRLYTDMGMEYLNESQEVDFNNGLGIFDSKLAISSLSQFMMINKYVTLEYVLTEDLDLSDYDMPIAAHKVFYGSIDGDKNTIQSFGKNVESTALSAYGLIARLDGQISNFVLDKVDLDISYTGADTFYVGLIAGKMYGNAIVSNIITLGNISVASQDNIIAGGIAGLVDQGNIYDVFSMNNIKIVGATILAGGIVGVSSNARLASYNLGAGLDIDGAIFSIGRVESISTENSSVGTVVGSGNIASSSQNSMVFALVNNAYSNGNVVPKTIGSVSGNSAMTVESFTNPTSVMRGTYFSDNTNVFDTVFGSGEDRLYPLAGLGTTNNKFIIRSNSDDITVNDFVYINQALFASYNVEGDITFAPGDFVTIGKGLVFTGSIDGKNKDSDAAETGTVSSLLNVTDALIYYNKGVVNDLVVNVSYTKNVVNVPDADYDLVFGAIAVYNDGEIKNVTVSGDIVITSSDSDSTVVVSGFVGINKGGMIVGDNKIQNSISGLNISISNIRTVFAGGYIGIVDGSTTLRYGIGSGIMEIEDCQLVHAGTVIGEDRFGCDLGTIEELQEYQYLVSIDGVTSGALVGFSVLP